MENIPVIADYKIVRALSSIAARQIKYIQRPFNGSPYESNIAKSNTNHHTRNNSCYRPIGDSNCKYVASLTLE